MKISVRIHTLGCKLNYAESSTYVRQFAQRGVGLAEEGQPADIEVVNSCAVTEQAQRKARQLLHRVQRENPSALRVLVGCYADLSGDALRERGVVALAVGRGRKASLADLAIAELTSKDSPSCEAVEKVESFFPAYSVGGRTRAFLKVQDGCNYGCSYCTIPIARGPSRSGSIADALREAEAIVARGVQEVVLTGVNTGEFGRGHGESLEGLLRALALLRGLARIRVSSIEPNLLTDRLLAAMADLSVVMPHLHIPLQSGSRDILKAMRRRYTPEIYAGRIDAARRWLADPFIGVDVIVGFPGETEARFAETFALLQALAPAYLHVFPFSPRPGTPAADMPERPASEAVAQRVQRLMDLSSRLHSAYCLRHAGQARRVLVERVNTLGEAEGFTDNYIRVQFRSARARAGDVVTVRLAEEVKNEVMSARAIEQEVTE